MATPNRLLRISSIGKLFIVVTIALLLLSGYDARAQDNTNGNTNANTTSTADTNVNSSENTNTPQASRASGSSTNRSAAPTPEPTPDTRVEARRDYLSNSYWFPVIISLMFGLVLIPFAWTIMRAIRFSKHTFSSPLGLPEGSLRAMLAFMLVAFLGFYVLVSILSLSELKPPDFLLGIVATVIGFYFGSRSGEEKSGGATAAPSGSVAGTVVDNAGAPAGGATVELSQPGGKKFTDATDAKGEYKFDKVPVGDYDIQASLTGHTPSDPAKVKVKSGANQAVDLKLK